MTQVQTHCCVVTDTFELYQRVLVRNNDAAEWRANIFSHYIPDEPYPFYCVTGNWKQCIPAEGNEHLVGTSAANFKFGDMVEVSNGDEWYTAVFLRYAHDSPHRYCAVKEGQVTALNYKYCRPV